MLEHLGKRQWKKQLRLYGVLMGVCLVLAAGISLLMDQGREDREESAALRSLKSEVEEYRRTQGDKARREDLAEIWRSYEGKVSPEAMDRLKREYRTKLSPAEVEALQKAYEGMKGKKP
jgi:hypothetical protein